MPITLNAEGKHDLRVYVEEVSYSNLVTIDVLITEFAGGAGTKEDPYQIATAEQLDLIRYDLDAHYILVNNIDLKDYLSEGGAGYNDGKGWLPIGTLEWPFRGSFDGNGHVISNLYIDRSDEDYIGLFGYVSRSSLRDVRLENVDVAGMDYVGGLVSYNNGEVINCYTSGRVRGDYWVGGLTGYNYGTLTSSYLPPMSKERLT